MTSFTTMPNNRHNYNCIYRMPRKFRIIRNGGVLTQLSNNRFSAFTTAEQSHNILASLGEWSGYSLM
jgi:hypothetical protein